MIDCPECGREYIERHYYRPPDGNEFVAYIHELERIGKGRFKVTETCDVPAGTEHTPERD
jgi:hypothetical protein